MLGALALLPAALAMGLLSPHEASAQQPGNSGKKVAQATDKYLLTEDGWQIAITYRNSILGQDAPAVILVPRLGSDRLVWEGKDGLAEHLNKEGFAVVSVDLRKHGESKAPDGGSASGDRSGKGKGNDANLKVVDYERMVDNDLEAVKEFLYKEHQAKNLNLNKMAIVASETSTAIAVRFTVRDWLKRPYPDGPTPESSTPRGQDIRTLVFLSPEPNLRGFPINQELMELRNPDWHVASFTGFGTLDSASAENAKKFYQKLGGALATKEKPGGKGKERNKDLDRISLQHYPFKFRGTDLLQNKVKAEEDVILFLNKYLKELPGDWRDRKNRLTAK